MTGSDLYFLIQGLNDLSERMEQLRAKDDFSLTGTYPISGCMVEKICKLTDKACKIIDNCDFVPNRQHR